jgi:CubicO group peptidase (beta-lactamase class C family)
MGRALVPLLVVAAVASGCSAPAARTPAGRPGAYAAIAASIDAEIAAGRLTGVSVALVQRGEIVWEAGFGWADRAAGRRRGRRSRSDTAPQCCALPQRGAYAGQLPVHRRGHAGSLQS